MNTRLALNSEPSPMQGIMVARDVRQFDLLVEDMEAELGQAWGDLTLAEATSLLRNDQTAAPEFLALAISDRDEDDLPAFVSLVKAAAQRDVRVILIVDKIAPDSLQRLLKVGASDVVPYPLAAGALHDTVHGLDGPTRPLRTRDGSRADTDQTPLDPIPNLPGRAAIFAVHALAGGTGASTLAANMAWEIATIDKRNPPSVCLMDFDLQRATMSAYLDLPRRGMVADLLQDATSMDVEGFKQALAQYGGQLSVLPAPSEVLPLDIVGPTEIQAVLDLAAQCFDVIVIDMPQTLLMWTETVLNRSDIYFVTLELDMRSAQNAMRFQKALQAENLPDEKLNFVLNRAPGRTDLTGRARVNKLCQTLDISIALQLPDGGKAVRDAGDNGTPLAETARKNPLRREIQKLCTRLHSAMLNDTAMAS